MIYIPSNGDELLETQLNKATNPLNKTLNVSAIDAFCDQVLKEPAGSQTAVRLLAHKVQSPQEKEALYSFSVIDECVKKCGPRFHHEIGKFRFLNELMKIISPKFPTLNTSPVVKTRCIECLYGLYKGIPHEAKFTEAYLTVKGLGIVIEDPTYLDDKIYTVTTKRTKNIFEACAESERLSKLLKSRKPEDLKEANQIIQKVVDEDNNRKEQSLKRQMEMDTMRNNTKLLCDMLSNYSPGHNKPDDISVMKICRLITSHDHGSTEISELVNCIRKSRTKMFKLELESDDDDDDVIDHYDTIINRYLEKMVADKVVSVCETPDNQFSADLLGERQPSDPLSKDLESIVIINTDLGPQDTTTTAEPAHAAVTTKYDDLANWFHSQSFSPSIYQHNLSNETPTTVCKGFEDLDILSKELFDLHKKINANSDTSNQDNTVELLSSPEDDTLVKDSLSHDTLPLEYPNIHNHLSDGPLSPTPDTNVDLTKYHINLNTIKPHSVKIPIVIYNCTENKVKVTLYFGEDRPHPNVSVLVAQITNESNWSVTDIVLKFAVAKPMRVRKQTGSSNTLSAHSPFTPSVPINEVVLIYHPCHDSVDLKYQLSYELNGELFLESANTDPLTFDVL